MGHGAEIIALMLDLRFFKYTWSDYPGWFGSSFRMFLCVFHIWLLCDLWTWKICGDKQGTGFFHEAGTEVYENVKLKWNCFNQKDSLTNYECLLTWWTAVAL